MSESLNFENNSQSSENARTIKNEIFDWVQNVTFILSAIVLIFIFLVRIVGVSGSSMEPTLADRDWLLTSNLFYEPKQGDIVILSKDTFKDGEMIVKRVIATEHQTIDIDFDEGIVRVDGVVLDEPYIKDITRNPINMTGPITVPEDCVFVMGDNRNNSADSRDSRIGTVHKSNIHGRVILRILPFQSFGMIK